MSTSAETTTPELTEAEAIQVIVRGVTREVRTESHRTLSYCKDATKLRGFSVRKLANKAEDLGKIANSDSYQSNVSNANGIMGLFEYNLDEFSAWLETSETKSLSAIYKAFRKLFVEPKPAKEKASNDDASESGAGNNVALIDQMIANLVHLTPEERVRLIEAAFAMDNGEQAEDEDDVADAA
jgi:hypothetical protein